ncbi:hypothetical protein [Saccharopolyspora shandongensis]|uniref:hypothetical protein n=1 Tax=Saccharopolyspora shandongensis TaxID=418495 RepID=UPI0033E433E0
MRLTAPAAILPSRDEPCTIAGVALAVDDALADDTAAVSGSDPLLLHADASSTPDTAEAFGTTTLRSPFRIMSGLECGKGRQIMHALDRINLDRPVLIADTRTRNPSPELYRALLDAVRRGAAIAVADHPRWWDEAHLTHHLARPLTAATLGIDVPQPLAGDIALSPAAWHALRCQWRNLTLEMKICVGGADIDAFLLQTAAAPGRVESVRATDVKRHAAHFPRPATFREVASVLLAPAATTTPHAIDLAVPRIAYRPVAAVEITARRERLAAMKRRAAAVMRWPAAVATAWRAVATGTPATDVSEWLWPSYLHKVRMWLHVASMLGLDQRQAHLHTWMTEVLTAITHDTPRTPTQPKNNETFKRNAR